MKNNACFAAIAAAMTLCACGPAPDTTMEIRSPKKVSESRVSYEGSPPRVDVARIGVFEDDAAYNGRRAIYIITDRKTGQEFIGISGIGISETGSHQCGKTRCTDER